MKWPNVNLFVFFGRSIDSSKKPSLWAPKIVYTARIPHILRVSFFANVYNFMPRDAMRWLQRGHNEINEAPPPPAAALPSLLKRKPPDSLSHTWHVVWMLSLVVAVVGFWLTCWFWVAGSENWFAVVVAVVVVVVVVAACYRCSLLVFAPAAVETIINWIKSKTSIHLSHGIITISTTSRYTCKHLQVRPAIRKLVFSIPTIHFQVQTVSFREGNYFPLLTLSYQQLAHVSSPPPQQPIHTLVHTQCLVSTNPAAST